MFGIYELFNSPKSIDSSVKWSEDNADWYRFEAPLSINGITLEGTFLRGKAAKNYVDRGIMIQLEIRNGTRSTTRLARADWRPLHTHNNKGLGPPELRFMEIKGSHLHTFDDNFLPGENRMRGKNLPVARPLFPEPRSYEEFVDEIGKYFRINNMGAIEAPPAQAILL